MYSAINLVTKTIYKNTNADELNFKCRVNRYKYNVWLTFVQANKLGLTVKKGQKGTRIQFFSKDETVKKGDKGAAIIKFFTVFNVCQCEVRKDEQRMEVESVQLEDGNTITVEAIACSSTPLLMAV